MKRKTLCAFAVFAMLGGLSNQVFGSEKYAEEGSLDFPSLGVVEQYLNLYECLNNGESARSCGGNAFHHRQELLHSLETFRSGQFIWLGNLADYSLLEHVGTTVIPGCFEKIEQSMRWADTELSQRDDKNGLMAHVYSGFSDRGRAATEKAANLNILPVGGDADSYEWPKKQGEEDF